MKTDRMMTEGYSAVRDKSNDRYCSSEDEMDFNTSQVIAAQANNALLTNKQLSYVNPTKNPNIKFRPSDSGQS